MILIKNTLIRIIIIATICLLNLIFIQSKLLAPNPEIIVDVNKVTNNFSGNPIGINLNFLLDRKAIVNPAKKIKLGSLRYPMGEIADYYLFDGNSPDKPKISIRDSSFRFTKFYNSDGTWKNSLNFDQFINICRSLNAEPFIVVGIDALAYQGTSPHANFDEVLQAAVDWVTYANIIQGYNIKHWEIGNENDLSNTHVNWTAENYAQTVVKFSRAMKQVDPSIQIGVNGMKNMSWWEQIMPIVKNDVDFLVTHQYSAIQNYKQWSSNNWNYTNNIEMANQVIKKYNPKLKLNVTEISSFNVAKSHPNNIWKMLHNFEIIGNTLNFDTLDYLHFWISRWFAPNSSPTNASAFNQDYDLMPMAYSLKIWGNFIHQQMVDTTNINKAGKIRSWASFDPKNASLSLFVLNKALQTQQISIKLKNYEKVRKSQQWTLSGNSPSATKAILQKSSEPPLVENSQISLKLPPLSITVMALEQ